MVVAAQEIRLQAVLVVLVVGRTTQKQQRNLAQQIRVTLVAHTRALLGLVLPLVQAVVVLVRLAALSTRLLWRVLEVLVLRQLLQVLLSPVRVVEVVADQLRALAVQAVVVLVEATVQVQELREPSILVAAVAATTQVVVLVLLSSVTQHRSPSPLVLA